MDLLLLIEKTPFNVTMYSKAKLFKQIISRNDTQFKKDVKTMDYGTKVIMHYAITDSDDIEVIKRRVDSLPLRIGQIPSHLVEARDGKGSGRELGILVADTEDTGLTILLDVWRHIVKRERNTTNLRRLLTATGGARLEVPETGGKSIYNSSGMDLVYDRNGAERRVHIDYFSTFPVLHNGEGA